MIATKQCLAKRQRPSFAVWLVLAVLVAAGTTGCGGLRETTIARSARARAAGEHRDERERQERELAIWTATRDELVENTDRARSDSIQRSSERRSAEFQLGLEEAKLAGVQQRLEAAVAQAIEYERQLKPLRELEQQAAKHEELVRAAEERVQKLAGEVAKATEGAAKQEAQLRPRLAKLQQRLADLAAAGVSIAEAEARVAAAAKVLGPPAKESAKQPANKQPAKKKPAK